MSNPLNKPSGQKTSGKVVTNDRGISQSPTYKIKTPPPKPPKK